MQAISYIYDDVSVGSGVGFTLNNALSRLTRVTFQGGYYLYSYNADGQVERMYNKLDGLGGKTVHYIYNRLGEVTQVRYQPGASNSHSSGAESNRMESVVEWNNQKPD